MKLVFDELAKKELFDGIEYYDHIYVIAIAHMHREPSYWVNRINPI
jgi:hypothetical protein